MGNKFNKNGFEPIGGLALINNEIELDISIFDIDYDKNRLRVHELEPAIMALKIWRQYGEDSLKLFDNNLDRLYSYFVQLFGALQLTVEEEKDTIMGVLGNINTVLIKKNVIAALKNNILEYSSIIINNIVDSIMLIKKHEGYDEGLVLYKMSVIRNIVEMAETTTAIIRPSSFKWEFDITTNGLGIVGLEILTECVSTKSEKTMYLAIILSYQAFRHKRFGAGYFKNNQIISFLDDLLKINCEIIRPVVTKTFEFEWKEYIRSRELGYCLADPTVLSLSDFICIELLQRYPLIFDNKICDVFCNKFYNYVSRCEEFKVDSNSDIKSSPLWFMSKIEPKYILRIMKSFEKVWKPYITLLCFYSAILHKNVDILEQLFVKNMWRELKRESLEGLRADLISLLEYNKEYQGLFVRYYGRD